MMKKIMAATLAGLALLVHSHAFAKSDQAIQQEATQHAVTVAQIKTLADETGVTLAGHIVRHISGDDFEFKDASGSIVIEVDDDLWKPMQLKAGDKVRLIGEVDTHRRKPTDIEVISIEKIQ